MQPTTMSPLAAPAGAPSLTATPRFALCSPQFAAHQASKVAPAPAVELLLQARHRHSVLSAAGHLHTAWPWSCRAGLRWAGNLLRGKAVLRLPAPPLAFAVRMQHAAGPRHSAAMHSMLHPPPASANLRDAPVYEREHGLRVLPVLCITMPQLAVLAATPAEDHAARRAGC